MQRLEVLGHWFRPQAPSALPRPQLLVGTWDPAARAAVVRHLRAGKTLVTFPEPSFCRFDCGEVVMGTRDLTDGRFVWPEGLPHYVERHDVLLPEHFVAHAVAANGIVAPFRLPKPTFGLYDLGPWQRWAHERGACLELTGFELPDAEVRERIAAELGDIGADAILLCRGSTREVVLTLADGALELRQARAGGAAPRRFAGWHEWPIARGSPAPAAPAPAAPSLVRRERPRPGVPMADFLAALGKKRGPDEPSR